MSSYFATTSSLLMDGEFEKLILSSKIFCTLLPKYQSKSNHNNYKLVNFFPGTLNAKIVTNQKPEIDFPISIPAKKCASNRQVKISLMPFVPTDFSFTILQKETAFLYLESII